MSNLRKVEIAKNDLGYDAWGRPKTITDHSLFSALWSLSIPNRVWLQYNDIGAGWVEQLAIDKNLVKSTHGHLLVTGTSITDVYLRSKRHPRYQPNKGMLYSTATILPNPNYVGFRDFGLINISNGIYFQLEGSGVDWKINIIRESIIDGVLDIDKINITAEILAEIPNFDPSKGHVYDIQMEWRGVGDFFIFVDLIKVYTFNLLGTLTELSISNPALSITYRCHGAAVGNDLLLIAGCVDVTSEGGNKQNKAYTSVNTSTVLLSTSNAGVAIIAVRLPLTINYDGNPVVYTRDMILTEVNTFCKDEAFVSVFFSRFVHTPNLEALVGWSTNTDSFYEWKINDNGDLNTAFQLDKASMEELFSTRTEKDFNFSHKNPDPDNADFYITAGDIILVQIDSDAGSTGGATIEFAEEV